MAIVVGTDFSDRAREVANLAAELAKARRQTLFVVHVADGPVIRTLRDLMALEERRLVGRGCRAEGIVEPGPRVGAMVALVARRVNASLVVVGAQGEGTRTLLGSTATGVIHHSEMPLLVVRKPERLIPFVCGKGVRALVCAGLDDTDVELRNAIGLLARLGPVDAHIAHYRVLPDNPAQRADAVRLGERDVFESLGALPVGVSTQTIIRDGYGRLDTHVAELAAERSVDVVVVGSHRRRGLDRVLEGSVAEAVVSHAPVSVLIGAACPG